MKWCEGIIIIILEGEVEKKKKCTTRLPHSQLVLCLDQ